MSITGPSAEITTLLKAWGTGDEAALSRLAERVYPELRLMARRHLKNEGQGNTLQATELVHEVYFRLVDVTKVEWRQRAQFFAMAAQMMRRILVDAARARGAHKRGGSARKVNLDETALLSSGPDRSLLALDEALTEFSQVAPRQARVVELRYFGGLTEEEIVALLEISPRTVRRDWDLAKAWLLRELSHKDRATADSMTPERFQRIEELYHAVRERTAEERAAVLAQTDPELRREVESLLASRAGGEFLERPAIENAPELPGDSTLTLVALGASLGPYRIESKLGEGGMGEVFRAVDTRLGRAVAIKTMQERFSARFEREARAISSLNHANICTLYDVGPNYLLSGQRFSQEAKCPALGHFVMISTDLAEQRQSILLQAGHLGHIDAE